MSNKTGSYRIGVDIGGTFTDFTVAQENGDLLLWKQDSTPDDPGRAVVQGLSAVAEQMDTDVAGLLGETELFVHGTTVATNMLIQRNGPTIGLLCTEGFRDVLYFRDGYKPERFNMHLAHPQELVDRWLRIGVPGRFDPTGDEVTALGEDEVRAAAAQFREAGVKAVAIAFLWSMLYPEHEQRAAAILREELPGVDVICSADVLPEDTRVPDRADLPARGRRPRLAPLDHADQRRLRAGAGDPRPAGEHPRLRPGRGPGGGAPLRRLGRRQPDLGRHGRHQPRRLPDRRRPRGDEP